MVSTTSGWRHHYRNGGFSLERMFARCFCSPSKLIARRLVMRGAAPVRGSADTCSSRADLVPP